MFSKKRGQAEHHKWLIFGIIIVLIVIVAAVFFLLKPKGEEPEPNPLAEQCAFACDSGQKVSFCDVERTVRNSVTATCDELSTNADYSGYSVEPCPAISCVAEQSDTSCAGLGATWQTPSTGSCPAQTGKFVRERTATDEAPSAGQICCYYYE